jgi:methylase of polypeptide subunit release factors
MEIKLDKDYLFIENSPKQTLNWYGFEYETSPHTDGGIVSVHDGVLKSLHRIFGKDKVWNNVLDWCAGDGGVGMMLLGSKIANKVNFMEPYKKALDNLYKNLSNNNISANVFELDKVADLTGKYDLVIANPPHNRIPTLQRMYELEWVRKNKIYPLKYEDALNDFRKKTPHRQFDFNWKIHIEFFENIEKNLNPGADVILIENPLTFNPLIWEWGKTNLKLKCWIDNNQIKEFTYPQVVLHFKYE